MAKHNNTYTILFISVIALVCSLLLSTAASGLKKRQDANIAFDVKKNILKAFGALPKDATRDSVESFFSNNIRGAVVNHQGIQVAGKPESINPEFEEKNKSPEERLYPVYILQENDKPVAYTIPIIGKGLWSKLYGYLSLNNDLNTVRGITFYKHGETPGLGAEIAASWFQDNFKDKQILDGSGNVVSVSVAKGKAADFYEEPQLSHYVDGISGATITSRGVTKMLKKDLNKYQTYFARLRNVN